MHLQVVDRQHWKFGYKVWLENKGKRVFEPVGNIPAKIVRSLMARVESDRPSIEAEWIHLMIELRWLTLSLKGPVVTLVAYPGSPNRFERKIDLGEHLTPEVAARLKPIDVGFNSEFSVIEIWPKKPESRRPFIRIERILWTD